MSTEKKNPNPYAVLEDTDTTSTDPEMPDLVYNFGAEEKDTTTTQDESEYHDAQEGPKEKKTVQEIIDEMKKEAKELYGIDLILSKDDLETSTPLPESILDYFKKGLFLDENSEYYIPKEDGDDDDFKYLLTKLSTSRFVLEQQVKIYKLSIQQVIIILNSDIEEKFLPNFLDIFSLLSYKIMNISKYLKLLAGFDNFLKRIGEKVKEHTESELDALTMEQIMDEEEKKQLIDLFKGLILIINQDSSVESTVQPLSKNAFVLLENEIDNEKEDKLFELEEEKEEEIKNILEKGLSKEETDDELQKMNEEYNEKEKEVYAKYSGLKKRLIDLSNEPSVSEGGQRGGLNWWDFLKGLTIALKTQSDLGMTPQVRVAPLTEYQKLQGSIAQKLRQQAEYSKALREQKKMEKRDAELVKEVLRDAAAKTGITTSQLDEHPDAVSQFSQLVSDLNLDSTQVKDIFDVAQHPTMQYVNKFLDDANTWFKSHDPLKLPTAYAEVATVGNDVDVEDKKGEEYNISQYDAGVGVKDDLTRNALFKVEEDLSVYRIMLDFPDKIYIEPKTITKLSTQLGDLPVACKYRTDVARGKDVFLFEVRIPDSINYNYYDKNFFPIEGLQNIKKLERYSEENTYTDVQTRKEVKETVTPKVIYKEVEMNRFAQSYVEKNLEEIFNTISNVEKVDKKTLDEIYSIFLKIKENPFLDKTAFYLIVQNTIRQYKLNFPVEKLRVLIDADSDSLALAKLGLSPIGRILKPEMAQQLMEISSELTNGTVLIDNYEVTDLTQMALSEIHLKGTGGVDVVISTPILEECRESVIKAIADLFKDIKLLKEENYELYIYITEQGEYSSRALVVSDSKLPSPEEAPLKASSKVEGENKTLEKKLLDFLGNYSKDYEYEDLSIPTKILAKIKKMYDDGLEETAKVREELLKEENIDNEESHNSVKEYLKIMLDFKTMTEMSADKTELTTRDTTYYEWFFSGNRTTATETEKEDVKQEEEGRKKYMKFLSQANKNERNIFEKKYLGAQAEQKLLGGPATTPPKPIYKKKSTKETAVVVSADAQGEELQKLSEEQLKERVSIFERGFETNLLSFIPKITSELVIVKDKDNRIIDLRINRKITNLYGNKLLKEDSAGSLIKKTKRRLLIKKKNKERIMCFFKGDYGNNEAGISTCITDAYNDPEKFSSTTKGASIQTIKAYWEWRRTIYDLTGLNNVNLMLNNFDIIMTTTKGYKFLEESQKKQSKILPDTIAYEISEKDYEGLKDKIKTVYANGRAIKVINHEYKKDDGTYRDESEITQIFRDKSEAAITEQENKEQLSISKKNEQVRKKIQNRLREEGLNALSRIRQYFSAATGGLSEAANVLFEPGQEDMIVAMLFAFNYIFFRGFSKIREEQGLLGYSGIISTITWVIQILLGLGSVVYFYSAGILNLFRIGNFLIKSNANLLYIGVAGGEFYYFYRTNYGQTNGVVVNSANAPRNSRNGVASAPGGQGGDLTTPIRKLLFNGQKNNRWMEPEHGGNAKRHRTKHFTNKNRKENKTKKPRRTLNKNKKSKHNSSQKKNKNKKTKTKKHKRTIRNK